MTTWCCIAPESTGNTRGDLGYAVGLVPVPEYRISRLRQVPPDVPEVVVFGAGALGFQNKEASSTRRYWAGVVLVPTAIHYAVRRRHAAPPTIVYMTMQTVERRGGYTESFAGQYGTVKPHLSPTPRG